jgi:transketolase
MPSWEVFEEQEPRYKAAVLPPVTTFAVEAGVTLGWSRYTGSEHRVLGINTFGASAPGNIAMERYGMTVDSVVSMVRKELSK